MIPSPGDQITLEINVNRNARTGRFTTDQDVTDRPGETTTEQR